jgi:hypothetical protein
MVVILPELVTERRMIVTLSELVSKEVNGSNLS